MAKIDFLLGQDGDLQIAEGGFVMGESKYQDASRIWKLNKGQVKRDPLIGFGAIRYINSDVSIVDIKTQFKLHLARDNKRLESFKLLNGVYYFTIE
jgi:hypothetical protein